MTMNAKLSERRLSAPLGAIALFAFLTPTTTLLAGHNVRPSPPDRSGNWFWTEPVYETRYRTVTVPAAYETRLERIWIEPVYREERVRVLQPAVWETRTERVWVPGSVNLNLSKHRKDKRRAVEVTLGRWETVTRRVCVQPAAYQWEVRRVLVEPGCWRMVERQVCVREAYTTMVTEQVLVHPGCWSPAPVRRAGFNFGFSFRR
jgi:hypothetical protein